MKEGKMIFLYDSCLKTCVDSKTFAFWAYLVFTLTIIECFSRFGLLNNAKTARNYILHVLYLRVAIYCLQGKSTKAFEQKKDKVKEDEEEYP